jgi:glycosyltransferase involved in cell wall biosynthesis
VTVPLLLHIFPSFTVGGAQARFATLANRLGGRYRHAVVAMDGARTCADRLECGIDVTYPDVAVVKGDALGNLRRFRTLIRTLRPDLMITSNWGSIEWAILNTLGTVPHIHMEDGFGPEERARQLPRRIAVRRVALHRSLVMLPSLTLWKIATEQWRLNAGRLRYIPNGIDLVKFHPRDRSPSSPDVGWSGGPETYRSVVIGSVAGLRPEKNLARLIRAFAPLHRDLNAKLEIAGDGPERLALVALARELGVESAVAFLGHVADPAPLYHRWDIFALASDTEQMPISILEAMAAGLPVAATDVGDIRAMLSDGNRPSLAALDADDLCAKLRELAGDMGRRGRVGAANRRRVEEVYGEPAMVDAHAALFEEALRGPRPGFLN